MIDFKNGKFSAKALDFFENSDAGLCILHGSVRSSKTVNCTLRWITYCLDGPPGDLMMVGKTIGALQRNVLNDLYDILGKQHFKWVNRHQGELKILGRRVFVIGASTEEAEAKIRGSTLAGAYCDEANLYPQSFWNQLMTRCSVAKAQIFANCNPDSPNHWFYKDVLKNDEIKDKKVWHFTLDDNPNLDPDYRKRIEASFSGVFYRRFILGEWVVADGLIYDMFNMTRNCYDPQLNIYEDILDDRRTQFYVGCDYATASVMTWSLFAYNYPLYGDRKIKVSEFYYDARVTKRQKTDSEFLDSFKEWLDQQIPSKYVDTVVCDPSASSWITTLRNAGYNVRKANNDVINGIRFVSSELSRSNFIINKDLENTLNEYQTYSWDSRYQKMGEDKPLKENDHTCDADRYVLYTLFAQEMGGSYAVR